MERKKGLCEEEAIQEEREREVNDSQREFSPSCPEEDAYTNI